MAEQQARNRLPAASRRAQIMKVAADLFAARAYEETSMEAIAQQVGIRKASLYYYFNSKDDLLTQMHQERLEPIIYAHHRRVDAGDLDARGLLLAMMTDLVSLMEIHPGHMRVLFEYYEELPEAARANFTELRDRYRRMLIDVLDKGVAEGAFAIADAHLTALAILGMCSSTYQWFRPGGEHTATEVAQCFFDIVMNGIDGEK
ncbi:MAG TPA: TetR/AcrR family transcriptional regulator [Mycobacterium sp.]|nr:TetR/AcrR family transcriptional regulator [Mycobacterium sp.]